jgi:AP2 domain
MKKTLYKHQKEAVTAGFKGVYLRSSGRYRAIITTNGKIKDLGSFATLHEAAEAYKSENIKLHKDFSRI